MAGDERFRTTNGVRWAFWVISDDVDQYAAYRIGEHGIISSKDNVTVGIRTWGQIIEENKARLQFFQEKLEHQGDDETAMKHLREKYRKFLAGVVTDEPADTPSEDEVLDGTLKLARRLRAQARRGPQVGGGTRRPNEPVTLV